MDSSPPVPEVSSRAATRISQPGSSPLWTWDRESSRRHQSDACREATGQPRCPAPGQPLPPPRSSVTHRAVSSETRRARRGQVADGSGKGLALLLCIRREARWATTLTFAFLSSIIFFVNCVILNTGCCISSSDAASTGILPSSISCFSLSISSACNDVDVMKTLVVVPEGGDVRVA